MAQERRWVMSYFSFRMYPKANTPKAWYPDTGTTGKCWGKAYLEEVGDRDVSLNGIIHC